MNACGEHAGMLAGAIVVDRKRPGAAPHEIAKSLLADRPMRAAGKVALIDPCASEQASHRLDMHAVAAMRGAGDRKLGVAQPERIGSAALDQQNRLERLHRGAREDGTFDVAKRECELSGRIGDGDRAGMAAFHELSAHHLDEHGIAGSAHRPGGMHRSASRAGRVRPRAACLGGKLDRHALDML